LRTVNCCKSWRNEPVRRVAQATAVALCCACSSGPYSIPAPTAETRVGAVTNDSLALRATVVLIREPYSDLRLEIKATNRLDRPVNLMVPGGCPVILQVLNGAPPSGRVLWDSRYARSSMGCALSLVQARINPDESKTFVRGVERAEILGDSLPPARYFIRGLLDIEPTAVVVDAGEITISK
jgi:hypothetical protein